MDIDTLAATVSLMLAHLQNNRAAYETIANDIGLGVENVDAIFSKYHMWGTKDAPTTETLD